MLVFEVGSKVDFRAEGAGLEPASARKTRWIISPLPYQLGVTLRFKGGVLGFKSPARPLLDASRFLKKWEKVEIEPS